MKKVLVVIFSVFYLLVTVGLAVDVHYCSGELASVQLFSETNSCCDDEGDCSTNCCHSSSEVIQFEEQQTLLGNYRLNIEQAKAQPAVSDLVYSPYFQTEKNRSTVAVDFYPPPNEPVWLLHCSLVYYG